MEQTVADKALTTFQVFLRQMAAFSLEEVKYPYTRTFNIHPPGAL